MAILLGVAASVLLGISDALGRAGARRANPISHVSTAMASGFGIAVVASFLLRSSPLIGALAYGAIAGVFTSFGLVALYRGMAQTSAAVVAPPTAVFAAIVPFTWDLIQGTTPSPLAALGCAVAIVFLGLSTFSPTKSFSEEVLAEASTPRFEQNSFWLSGNTMGLLLGIAAGLLIGSGNVFVATTPTESGAWPAAASQLVGFSTMAALASRHSTPIVLPNNVLWLGVLGGAAGALGITCLILGVQGGGDLGQVAVAASMSPAVAILIATVFDGDKIRWWQIIGIAGSILGVSLIALGQ